MTPFLKTRSAPHCEGAMARVKEVMAPAVLRTALCLPVRAGDRAMACGRLRQLADAKVSDVQHYPDQLVVRQAKTVFVFFLE
jgi:hypothetical protein